MIFVVGNSRSGTTMLGRMLGRNSKVFSFPELHLFGPCIPHGQEEQPLSKEDSIRAFAWLLDVSRRGFHAARTPEAFVDEATTLTAKYWIDDFDALALYYCFVHDEARRNGKEIPCEDLPGNVFRLDALLRRFPEARFVHIVRDPRDVLLSQKNRHLRRKMGGWYVTRTEAFRVWANYHPWVISRLWNAAVNAGLQHDSARIYTMRFEDLIAAPEATLQAICNHCGFAFEAGMTEVPQVGSSTQKDNPDKKGVDSSRAGAWQRGGLNDAEIAICEKMNGSLMEKLHYPLVNKSAGLTGFGYALLLPFKGTLAVLLNRNRTKGLWRFVKSRFLR